MNSNNIFKPFDYTLFCLSLCIPMSISVYFGCWKNKHKSGKEYLYGRRNLNAWSVGLSLYSGTISCLAILGTASEVYIFGTQFMMTSIGAFLSTLTIWYLILPVFVGNLDLKTPYEYFELRFNRKVRLVMSSLSALHSICFMSVVLYASTLPFSEATNISLPICTTIVGTICTVYTLIGGFVGVIWTDVIQASLMLFSCIFVMIKGVNESGGISKVWSIAEEGQRIQFFNFDPNPFVRLSVWSAVLGMIVVNTAFSGCTPGALQRFMAVSTEKGARISTAVATIGFGLLLIMAGIIGISIYARYFECDPVSSNQISTASRILPFFVNDIAGNIPGFVGFFSAGLLSAGLSSISADMNVISGIVYYDFLPNIFKVSKRKFSEIFVMKSSVLVHGIILMVIAPLMAKYQHIYQVALSLSSLTCAPITGVTILATSMPIANSKGILFGIASSLLMVGTLIVGTFNLDLTSSYTLPVSTDNCALQSNITDILTTTVTSFMEESDVVANEPFILFKLSYMYYSFLGFIVTVLVALIVSYCTGLNNIHKINPDLILPVLRVQNENTVEMKTMSNCDE